VLSFRLDLTRCSAWDNGKGDVVVFNESRKGMARHPRGERR
jgi:hypothetical protein